MDKLSIEDVVHDNPHLIQENVHMYAVEKRSVSQFSQP